MEKIKNFNTARKHHHIITAIIEKYNCKVMAEVGVHRGRTTRHILRDKVSKQIVEYFAIDPWITYIDSDTNKLAFSGMTQEGWDKLYLNVCKYYPWFPALKIMKLKSVEAASLFPNEYFDMVYIDGDHSYSEVKKDIKAWLPKIKKGGIISGHDYARNRENHNEVAKVVDEIFGKDFFLERCSIWYKEIK
jgi:hypothetical protein